MYTVYTYWNSDGVIAVLNAIVLIMGGNDYLGLMRTLAIAGLLVVCGVGLAKVSAKEPLQYFIFLGLFYFGLFVPKVTVDVVDVRTGGVGAVANVPFGVAFFYSSTSHVGKFLTDTFETNFQPVNNLRFGTTGMAFGARAFSEVASARVGDAKLGDGLREFTRGCINPEVVDFPDKYNALINSTDLGALLDSAGWLNPARSVTLPINGTDGYAYYTCTDGWAMLKAWMATETTNQLNFIARRLNPDKANPTSTWVPAQAAIAGQLADVEGYMLNTARTAVQQLQQGMMANAINDSGGSLAAARNDPAAMQAALAAKMAEMQANGAYRTMALIGEAALPKFRNIAEIVIFAVFPIVMLLIILGGEKGGAILKTYLLTAIWIQLWAPLYAIVNFMMQGGMSSRLQGSLDGATSQTILNTAALTMTAFKESSLAGALVFAVPVIAYALVRGGEVAMSGAMGGLTGPASGAASSAGSSVGTGNIQAGNTAWGNHSANNMAANKWDTSGSITQGGWSTREGQFGMSGTSGTAGGGDYGHANAGGMVANLGSVGASVGSMMQQSLGNSINENSMLSASATNSGVASIAGAIDKFKSSEAHSGHETGVTSSASTSGSAQGSKSFDSSFSNATSWAQGLTLTDGQKAAWTLAAGADPTGGSSNPGKDASGKDTGGFSSFKRAMSGIVKAGVGGSTESQMQALYQGAHKASQTDAFKDGMQHIDTALSSTGTDEKSSAGSRQSAGIRASLQEGRQALSQGAAAAQRSESAARIQQALASNSQGVTADMSNAVEAVLGGPQGVQALQSLPISQQVAKVQAAVDQVLSTPEGRAMASHGGATGPTAGRMAAIEGAAAGRTSGSGPSDLTSGGGTLASPTPGSVSGPTMRAVSKWESGQAAGVAGVSGSPSLPGVDGGAAVTPGSVRAGAAAQATRVESGISTGVKNTTDAGATTQTKVGQEQNTVASPGALAGRASEIALDSAVGLFNGRGGMDGGASVRSGKVPYSPPPGTPAPLGAGAIPQDPPRPVPPEPDTARRKSGTVRDDSGG